MSGLFKVYRWAAGKYQGILFGYKQIGTQVQLSVSFKNYTKNVFRLLDQGLTDKVYAEQYVEMVKELKA